jgi:hypothetical protein
MRLRAFGSVMLVLVAAAQVASQTETSGSRVGLDERAFLESLVEDAVSGRNLGGNAWLQWTPHFFRGPAGKTYIPFTLRVEEAPGAFTNAAMYVRMAARGDGGRAARRAEGVQNAVGIPAGELPINSPERRQGVGAPTASDASLMLRSLTAKPSSPYPYEAAYGVMPTGDGKTGLVRRSMTVPPGDYDLYIALLDRPRRGEKQKRWAILKRQVSIPDLNSSGLRLSSVVVADRVESLAAPLDAAEQAARPYALGAAEFVPAADDQLRRDETLHLAFVIYEASIDQAGMPDVRVEYRLYQRTESAERLLGATRPQSLDRTTLPANFDLRTGHQLAAVQSLPLASYAPGLYRLVMRVVDNRSGAMVEEEIRFAVE